MRIAIGVLALAMVLVAAIINGANWVNVRGELVETLGYLGEWNPQKDFPGPGPRGTLPTRRGNPSRHMRNMMNEARFFSVTVAEEPLLTHPNYNFLTGDYLTALKMLMDGYKESDVMTDSRNGEPITLRQLLSEVDTGDDNLVERVKKGQTHYMAPAVQVTCRYRASTMPKLGTSLKIGQPPSVIPTPPNHNWLALVPGVDMQNGEIWVSETYLLSAPGGWDTTIYG
jgi:hypothetical protein